MKKLVIAAAFLGLSTQVAHATKARLIALGQDKDGSYYLQDSRNFNLNPASINDMGHYAVVETGATGLGVNTNIETDTATKAEGGVFFGMGNLNYGGYLGNESDTAVLVKSIVAKNASAMPQSDNVVEVMVGGKNAVNWGVLFGTGANKDEQGSATKENKALYTRFGVSKDNWEAFAGTSLQGESEDKINNLKYDGDAAYQLGATYNFNDMTAFARYQTIDWKQVASSVSTKGSYNEIKVGVARIHELSATDRMFMEVRYEKLGAELKFASGTASADTYYVPLVVGYEAQANSWLTLRGSITHFLASEAKEKNVTTANFGAVGATVHSFLRNKFKLSTTPGDGKKTVSNSTDINAGATIKLGKISIDGLVGTGGAGGTATTTDVGTLSLDRLMTRVSMTYMF